MEFPVRDGLRQCDVAWPLPFPSRPVVNSKATVRCVPCPGSKILDSAMKAVIALSYVPKRRRMRKEDLVFFWVAPQFAFFRADETQTKRPKCNPDSFPKGWGGKAKERMATRDLQELNATIRPWQPTPVQLKWSCTKVHEVLHEVWWKTWAFWKDSLQTCGSGFVTG